MGEDISELISSSLLTKLLGLILTEGKTALKIISRHLYLNQLHTHRATSFHFLQNLGSNIVLILMSHLFCQKPSPLWGWAERLHHCPFGQQRICQTRLDLLHNWSVISDRQECMNNLPVMIICCPSAPGPANWPRREPPENISLAEVGSSFEIRTSTFFVRSPQQSSRL